MNDGVWLVKWRLSVRSERKFVGSTPPLVATLGPWASPSPVIIACITDVAPFCCLAANSTPVIIACCHPFILYLQFLRCVRLSIKRKYYYYYYRHPLIKRLHKLDTLWALPCERITYNVLHGKAHCLREMIPNGQPFREWINKPGSPSNWSKQ